MLHGTSLLHIAQAVGKKDHRHRSGSPPHPSKAGPGDPWAGRWSDHTLDRGKER